MASLSTDSNGIRRILYFHPIDGKRKTLYIGRMTDDAAATFLKNFKALLDFTKEGESFSQKTIKWIAELSDVMHGKLADAELIEPRPSKAPSAPSLDDYVKVYLDSRPHIKASTRRTCKTVLDAAAGILGKFRPIDSLTEREAGAMFKTLLDAGYARAFISKCIQVIRSMYRLAVREKLVNVNPFEFVKAGSQVNNARKEFIDGQTVRTLIDVLPCYEWRLLVALARWGGLRTPSEPFAMTWDHVLWDQSRLIIPVPKLEHVPGRETRTIPMFPELVPFLNAAWDAADPGTHLLPRLRTLSGNVSTQLKKYILRAGLKPWPRTWQNLPRADPRN